MIKRFFVLSIMLIAAISLLHCGGPTANIKVVNPVVKAKPASSNITAAFMELVNPMTEDDILLSAETEIARVVELHNMVHEDGMMKMKKVDHIKIPAKGSASLKPGGFHLMLIGIKKAIKEGDMVPLTLHFQNAGTKHVQAVVKKIQIKHHHKMDKKKKHRKHKKRKKKSRHKQKKSMKHHH